MKAIIVDDEEPARSLVREFLSAHRNIEIIAECANGFEAVKAVTEQHPDIMFLDIQMPKLNGFEVLELLDELPAVIFVTAFDQYALKAFEVHAADYLLKPFTQERFTEALNHALKQFEHNKHHSVKNLLADVKPESEIRERILIKEGSKVLVIPVEKIDYIEAQDDYVSLRVEGKSHLKQQRLSLLEEQLPKHLFVRIHRSYILNIERIAKIELLAKDSRAALLKNGTTLPISRTGYEKLKEML